eukprot:122068-Pelagomonas_calceolata.AAC.8
MCCNTFLENLQGMHLAPSPAALPALQLTKKEVKQIADIFLKDVFSRADEKGIKIEVTEKFKDSVKGIIFSDQLALAKLLSPSITHRLSHRLVTEGFNPAYGARPLRRAIMRLIEDCLAERILTGEIKLSPKPKPLPAAFQLLPAQVLNFSGAIPKRSEGDVVIMDVDPDGAIAVLAGDKKMRSVIDNTPAGIS